MCVCVYVYFLFSLYLCVFAAALVPLVAASSVSYHAALVCWCTRVLSCAFIVVGAFLCFFALLFVVFDTCTSLATKQLLCEFISFNLLCLPFFPCNCTCNISSIVRCNFFPSASCHYCYRHHCRCRGRRHCVASVPQHNALNKP